MSHEATTNPLAGVEARPGSGHYGVYDHGAHVWAWQPDGERPVLWMSRDAVFADGAAIRGGVPVIFPWFGGGPSGDLKPAHGLIRTLAWSRTSIRDTLEEDGLLVVGYRTDAQATGDSSVFPHAFIADLEVTFSPERLHVRLTVTNPNDHSITFEQALHTYLAVSDVRNITITGLDGVAYLDKVVGAQGYDAVQEGPVRITAETDRIYKHVGAVTLDDPGWDRSLVVSKEGSANLVVWNPWVDKAAAMADFGDDEWPGMVCIEAVNTREGAVTLAASESSVMTQTVTLVR